MLPFVSLLAATVQAEPVTLRLTDAQKEEILAAKTESALSGSLLPGTVLPGLVPFLPDDVPLLNDRRPHGEVGMMIGTGGARGIYGVTSVPLGERGWASFGFENSQNLWPGRY